MTFREADRKHGDRERERERRNWNRKCANSDTSQLKVIDRGIKFNRNTLKTSRKTSRNKTLKQVKK